jgi:hypothetical protein
VYTSKSNLSAIKRMVISAIILGITLSAIPKRTLAQINKGNNAMENKRLIQQGYDNWANGIGSFFDLLAEDVLWTITGSTPLSKTYTSKKQFMNEVIIPLDKRLSKRIIPNLTGLICKTTQFKGKDYKSPTSSFMS